MRLLSALAVLTLLVAGGSLALAQSIGVVGSLTREVTLTPGGTSTGSILVRNLTNAPQPVRLYQHDYSFQADGTNLYGEPGASPRSNADWITFAPQQFTLDSGETRAVRYEMHVPADPALTGTYWSVLMVEPAPPPPPPADPEKPGLTLRQVWRFAVQMITQIGSTGACELAFVNRRLLRSPEGACTLQLDLANRGERSLTLRVWVELFSAEGRNLGRFEASRMRLYPDCSGRFPLPLGNLAPGVYRALVVADNGDENVYGAQYELEIK